MTYNADINIKTFEVNENNWGWRLALNNEVIDGSYNYNATSPDELHAMTTAFSAFMKLNGTGEKMVFRSKRGSAKSKEKFIKA